MRVLLFIWTLFFLLSNATAQDKDLSSGYEWIRTFSIALTGKVPVSDELAELSVIAGQGITPLESYNLVLDYYFSLPVFYKHIEYQLREEYLENISRRDLVEYIGDFYQLDQGRRSSIYHSHFKTEFEKLLQLGLIQDGEFFDGISIREIQRLLVNNYIYGQINMGVDNFVLSIFQHFMIRKPTFYELRESKKMLSGNQGVLFTRLGSSKDDFLDIFFSSTNYFEGQVRYWHIKIMHEEPDYESILHYMPFMHEHGSPEQLIRQLLIDKALTML